MEFTPPLSEISFSFVRSSGPGGQNVNKVNSKAVLRWDVRSSPSLSFFNRNRLLEKLTHLINQDGELVLTSDRFRDQIRNREDCLEKLRELVVGALHVPKARKKTKPSFSSRVKKKTSNKRHSEKKSLRQKVR